MRLTVGRKVVAGLAVIVALGIASMLVIYRGLDIVEKGVNRLADVEGPLAAAAYEMEVNINGIGMAVLNYLATGLPEYRAWVVEDNVDFLEYHATYQRLVGTQREKKLAAEIAGYYAEYIEQGRLLMHTHDEQEKLFVQVTGALGHIDRVIDRDMPSAARLSRASADERHANALALANMEAEVAEIGFWLSNYQRGRAPHTRDTVFEKMRSFEGELARFGRGRLNERERALAQTLRETYAGVSGPIRAVVVMEDESQTQRATFIGLRYRMDVLLDTQIQVLLAQGLDKPRRAANAAAEEVVTTMLYLIPLFVLAASLVGWLLMRSLLGPLQRLRTGTEAVGRGDLGQHIAVRSHDEFADLAGEFNRMVAQLRETTVGKHLLESSEERLRHTVTDLRHQIVERERAEHEREGLHAQLRRTETMTAMGSLVAGVAHEVRNPLFGISSTLDAMDARFGSRPEYGRYQEVLRGEVDRLGKLMGDLLDLGKPSVESMAPGRVDQVVERAAKSGAALAASREVTIDNRMPTTTEPVRMASNRLMQAFLNLIENAVHHSPRGGTVSIDAAPCEAEGRRWIDCHVRDAGSGIREDDLARLFEPFFTRRRGGTGLGLSIVQRIVEEHGGSVVARNHPDGGALMTVRLPLGSS